MKKNLGNLDTLRMILLGTQAPLLLNIGRRKKVVCAKIGNNESGVG